MSCGRAGLAILLVAAACGGGPAIPAADLLLRVTTGADEVDLGVAFPVSVVRVWSKDLVPAEWDDRCLAPLTVRLVATSRREDERRVEETRTYRGYAFDVPEVRVPAVRFEATPRGGGTPRVAAGDAIAIRVRPAVDPKSPGPVELPSDPLPEPVPWRLAAAGTVAAAVALALLARRRRSAPTVPTGVARAASTDPAAVGPHVLALERIARLRARGSLGAQEIRADHVETAAIVREYVGERFDVRVREMTTEQVLAATARSTGAESHATLADALARCDLVKFACGSPSAADRERLLDVAERFVTGTRTP